MADALFIQACEAWDQDDLKTAFALFKQAARLGDPGSQHNLGYFYDCGLGTRKNIRQALYWYKKAAVSGSGGSASNIAMLYRDQGNIRRTIFWFGKACSQGDGDAFVELARLYLGRTNKRGVAQAIKCLRLALAVPRKTITEDSLAAARKLLKQAMGR